MNVFGGRRDRNDTWGETCQGTNVSSSSLPRDHHTDVSHGSPSIALSFRSWRVCRDLFTPSLLTPRENVKGVGVGWGDVNEASEKEGRWWKPLRLSSHTIHIRWAGYQCVTLSSKSIFVPQSHDHGVNIAFEAYIMNQGVSGYVLVQVINSLEWSHCQEWSSLKAPHFWLVTDSFADCGQSCNTGVRKCFLIENWNLFILVQMRSLQIQWKLNGRWLSYKGVDILTVQHQIPAVS